MNSYADGMYGCAADLAGGYNWNNSSWIATQFKKHNATIKLTENNRKMEFKESSDSSATTLYCVYADEWVKPKFLSCFNNFGSTVVFNETTMTAARSALNGAVFGFGSQSYKDSLVIGTYNCQKF